MFGKGKFSYMGISTGNLWLPQCIFIVVNSEAWISHQCLARCQICSALTPVPLWDLCFFFPSITCKKIFPADCEILQRKQSKEKQTNNQTKNYRAIPIQKPAFNKEISCHFFISKCTWCANANVRIACSINHNRKQYKFTIPECKDQSEKDKNRLFFSKSEGLPSQLCWNRRERTDLLVHKHGHSYAGLCNVK